MSNKNLFETDAWDVVLTLSIMIVSWTSMDCLFSILSEYELVFPLWIVYLSIMIIAVSIIDYLKSR